MMRKLRWVLLASVLIATMSARAVQPPATKALKAANDFLSTLSSTQRQSVVFAYDDEQQRTRWSNFPISIVPRMGLNMGELNAAQRASAMTLLSAVLSARGYEKVQQIMDGDEVLKSTDGGGRGGPGGPGGGPQGRGGRGGGPGGPGGQSGGLQFGKDLYYISFLGTPSDRNPWMIQFGGHHLALNITISGDQGILTPTLTGAQPALYTANGKTIRPLGGESDKSLALLNALTDDQRKQAILSYRVADLVLGPGQDGKTIKAEGLKASNMTAKQKDMLMDVISEWASIAEENAANVRMTQLKTDLADTWFAWSGPVVAAQGGITAYYRIQGPHLVIEYAPQQMGGDASMHIHTMYRDPTNDY